MIRLSHQMAAAVYHSQ